MDGLADRMLVLDFAGCISSGKRTAVLQCKFQSGNLIRSPHGGRRVQAPVRRPIILATGSSRTRPRVLHCEQARCGTCEKSATRSDRRAGVQGRFRVKSCRKPSFRFRDSSILSFDDFYAGAPAHRRIGWEGRRLSSRLGLRALYVPILATKHRDLKPVPLRALDVK
jgi:hypothetical protein